MKKAWNLFKQFCRSRWFYLAYFLVVLLLINGRQRLFTNFSCEICSDKAGYYMYLPAAFHMGFTAENYPQDFDHAHGDGFYLDRQQNKVITKFSCGVALLQAPFYAAGAVISKVFALQAAPYSYYYLFFISIGAALYSALGFFFCRKWLGYYTAPRYAFTIAAIAFSGTNLFYYTLDETLMSHLYSFTLFAGVLYGTKAYKEKKQWKYFLLLATCFSFAVLIRPTNILFACCILLLDAGNLAGLAERLRLIFTIRNCAAGIFIFLLVTLPQLIYWKFAFGHYVVWSYKDEGFTNWDRPRLLTVWFSPQSGLFPYTPLLLFSFALAVFMAIKKIPNAWLVLFVFFAVSYMCAAWHNPFFGECNFGKRPVVEYIPLLLFPLVYIFNAPFSKTAKQLTVAIIILCIYYNQALFSAFDTCFFGGTWDWKGFFALLVKGLPVIR